MFHPAMGHDGVLISLTEVMQQTGALILAHCAHDPATQMLPRGALAI